MYTEVSSFKEVRVPLYTEVSSLKVVGKDVYRGVLISGVGIPLYIAVLISGSWNRGSTVYSLRCPHFRRLE